MGVQVTRKSLTVFSLVMINVIAIDSLRNLPMNASYGWSIVFFYLLAGLVFFLPGALITAELATEWPRTGGSYVWVREAFGPKLSFMNIWLQWIYNVVWYPTILAFIATSIATLINPAWIQHKYFIATTIIVVFCFATLLNNLGMKVSGLLSEVGAILGTLLPIILIIVFAAIWYFKDGSPALAFDWHHIIPSNIDVSNLGFTVVVLFSLIGIEMSASHAEAVKNPRRDYPRALLISCLIIVVTLIMASVAIAVIIAPQKLDIVNGLNQAFGIFLSHYGLSHYLPWIEGLIIFGGFACMSAWVIGPAKGLLIAAQDGMLPRRLAYINRYDAPRNILLAQAGVVILLSLSFLILPTVSSAYWLLSDLTSQLALVYYLILFAAAIKLRYKFPKRHPEAYVIPGGKPMMWIVAGAGIIASLTAMVIGFIPPSDIPFSSPLEFVSLLLGGMLVFGALPIAWIIFRHKKANVVL